MTYEYLVWTSNGYKWVLGVRVNARKMRVNVRKLWKQGLEYYRFTGIPVPVPETGNPGTFQSRSRHPGLEGLAYRDRDLPGFGNFLL